jgi:hypothetical protein
MKNFFPFQKNTGKFISILIDEAKNPISKNGNEHQAAHTFEIKAVKSLISYYGNDKKRPHQ